MQIFNFIMYLLQKQQGWKEYPRKNNTSEGLKKMSRKRGLLVNFEHAT